ncbi:hypothetical protein F8S09_15270 [Deinococcus sp. SDU3-2]|uniref:Lipoprotein n=1 Tax=Deinococcus terrestris TaxID=2651870 RepID=A0A7X1NYB1_9DEIO|nr:hypothetical protein [Deinococcus terrestris]MPY68018.1 hypothetical protein [Deinococcus terrestris]
MRPSPRLALPLLSCALLLTACPGSPPPGLDVPSNPAVLHGTWTGTLTSDLLLRAEAFGDGRLYLLRYESGLGSSPEASAPNRKAPVLWVLDAASGAEVRFLPLEDAQAVRFRPAEGASPARLLVLHEPSIRPPPPARVPAALSERDPVTLEEVRRTPLPDRPGPYFLSADGGWLLTGSDLPDVPIDTRTGQPVALPASVREQLALPQPPNGRLGWWRSRGDFLYVEQYPGKAGETYRIRFRSTTSGGAFRGAAQHPATCTVTPSDLLAPTDLVNLPDGGAALAYRDGTVELRDAQDRLRKVVSLGGCSPYRLRVDGDVLTFAGEFTGSLGTLRVSDGTLLGQREAGTAQASPWPVGPGTAVWVCPQRGPGALLTLERASGEGWTLPAQEHRLTLDTRATWQSKTQYTSLGTATLDGERLNFSAVASAQGYELRPQTSPPIRRVVWQGELRRAGGELVARLEGTHGEGTARQGVQLELKDPDRDFAFVGELRR